MRLLLDENLPKRLKQDFAEHEVYTVAEKQWTGKQNGELLKLMLENGFAALLTFDKNLQHQQNFEKFPITVFVLTAPNNTYDIVKPLALVINAKLNSLPLKTGIVVISSYSAAHNIGLLPCVWAASLSRGIAGLRRSV
jgi:predicted nuclease of predicted toxin-antitoxin system